MTIDMKDPDVREQVEASAYAMSVTPATLIAALEGAEVPYPPTHPLGERGIESPGAPVGPRTPLRRAALAHRRSRLQDRLDAYGPSGNPTVAAVRSQTDVNELDKRARTHMGPGGAGPLPPNRRLATFGMRVVLDDSPQGWHLVGGTARQRACYLRSVKRYTR